MVGDAPDSKALLTIWDPKFQKVQAQSEVVFDAGRNAHMSCQDESNEINIFGLPEDEKSVDKTHTGGEPLRGQENQPTQIGKRSTSHMHEASDEEVGNIAHSWHLHRENQTAQHSAAEAENISHSWCIRREDHTAWHSAAAIKKSGQLQPASPPPPIASRLQKANVKPLQNH
jgi:hypothetical protein